MQHIQKDIRQKKCLETLSLFSQPEFEEKARVLPKLDRSCDVTERVIII